MRAAIGATGPRHRKFPITHGLEAGRPTFIMITIIERFERCQMDEENKKKGTRIAVVVAAVVVLVLALAGWALPNGGAAEGAGQPAATAEEATAAADGPEEAADAEEAAEGTGQPDGELTEAQKIAQEYEASGGGGCCG